GNRIRQVTFAPEECEDPHFIAWLQQHTIIASIGHSAATYEQTCAAIMAGCHHATHLFNAMTGWHHRDPGAVGAVLDSGTVTAELIVDGIHVHPEAVRLAYRM